MCTCGVRLRVLEGGAGEETEAERHRQAKDNTVCVCGGGGGAVWCVGAGRGGM